MTWSVTTSRRPPVADVSVSRTLPFSAVAAVMFSSAETLTLASNRPFIRCGEFGPRCRLTIFRRAFPGRKRKRKGRLTQAHDRQPGPIAVVGRRRRLMTARRLVDSGPENFTDLL